MPMMDANRLQDLVMEMLQFRPTTTSEHIARYIAAKTQGEISIAEVNTVLERLKDWGYVSLARTWQTPHDGTLAVVAEDLPTA
jgi:predicted transcriptional regulator